MTEDFEKIIRIATDEFRKLATPDKVAGIEVEEIEEAPSGLYFVTLGYWSKDSKPDSGDIGIHPKGIPIDLLNPWRRKYKRVEVDPTQEKAVSIKMYEPPLGIS